MPFCATRILYEVMEKRYRDTKDIYIGELIRLKVDERHISYAEFARLINRARTSIYHIFEAKTIDIDLLMLIGNVLDYDFIANVYMHEAPHPHGLSPCCGISHCMRAGNAKALSCLLLPIVADRIDVSGLPPAFIAMLRKALL